MHTYISAAVAVSSLLVFPASVSAGDMQQPWSLSPSSAQAAWQIGHNWTCDMHYDQSDTHGTYDDASYTHPLHGTVQSRTYYLPDITDDAAYLDFETYYDTANTQQGTSPSLTWVFSGSFFMPDDQGTFYIGVKPGIDLRGADNVKILPNTNGTDHAERTFAPGDLPNPDTKLVTLDGVAGQTVGFTITLGIFGDTSGEIPNEPPIITTYVGYGVTANAVPGPAGAATLLCSGLLGIRRRRRN